MIAVEPERLFEAMDHVAAIAGEFDNVESKLAAFGLEAEAVRALLEERYELAKRDFDPEVPEVLFVRGFIEGLLLGRKL